MYVDNTDGTDDLSHGHGTDSNAFKTVQFAVDQIPAIFGGDVTININNETYPETVTIRGKQPSGNYFIILQGTLNSQESATADSKTTGSGATQGTLTDTGAFAGDSYAKKLIYISNEDVYRIIDTHTDDVITIVGCFTNTTDLGYTIYDWGTTINRLNLGDGQKNVKVYDIKFAGDGDYSLYTNFASACSFYRCNFSIRLASLYSTMFYFDRCTFYHTGSITINLTFGPADIYGCYIENNGDAGICLLSQYAAKLIVKEGTLLNGYVDGSNKANYGIYAMTSGAVSLSTGSAIGYNQIKNFDTGCYAELGGMIRKTSTAVYTNCTTNENANASTYGYID